MKKLLLIPALIAGTFAMAEDYKFEVSPMIGYNFAEDKQHIKNDSYAVYGLEIQANSLDTKWSPELSFLYSEGVGYKTGNDTRIARGAFNGVYTFDTMGMVVPFAKAGAGYEKVSHEITQNKSGFFLDAGAGLKVPFTDSVALKLEAIYMTKGFVDSNLVTMAGLTFAFGAQEQKAAPVAVAPVVVAAPAPKPAPAPVVVAPVVVIDGDDDKDGVLNSKDKCPNTPMGEIVDEHGCTVKLRLNIHFANDSAKIVGKSQKEISDYAKHLIENPNYSSKIIGYTDSTGTVKYNQKLSERRASTVVDSLIAEGVNAKQLTAVGRGVEEPVADNKTAEGRAQNRRIEAEITKK